MNRDRHDELNELGLSAEERASMERMLAEFQSESAEQAERPELFWMAQKTRVMARLREPHAQRGLGWVATAVAATAMVVFLAIPTRQTQAPGDHTTATTSATQAASVDDEELLRSVSETTNSSVPDALAPANILASEMDRGLEGASRKATGRDNQ